MVEAVDRTTAAADRLERAELWCPRLAACLLLASSAVVFYFLTQAPSNGVMTGPVQIMYGVPALGMLWVAWGLWGGRDWAVVLAFVGSVVGITVATRDRWNLDLSHDSAEFIDFVDRWDRLILVPFPFVLILVTVAVVLRILAGRTGRALDAPHT